MGRSKFPGKPPKTVTRKRIKVLGRPEATQTEPVTVVAAENIYYGLSLFNKTFGDNEKEHPPFHGFSSKEAKLSVCYVKTQQRDTEEVGEPALKKVSSKCSVRKDIKDIKNIGENIGENNDDDDDDDKKKLLKINNSDNNRSKKILKQCVVKNKNNIVNKVEVDEDARRICRVKNNRSKVILVGGAGGGGGGGGEGLNAGKTPVLKPVNNILERHQRTRQLRNSTAKRLLQRAKSGGSVNTRNGSNSGGEKVGSVRKFVLPVRSVHSSRVIKPNKRFIEELEETCIPEISGDSLNEKQHKKARILNDSKGSTLDEVDRDMKKSKKIVQNIAANSSTSLNHTATGAEKSVNSTSNGQGSRAGLNESKKSQLLSNKNKSSGGKTASQSQDLPPSQINKSTNCTGSKQALLIPTKVLPDSSTTNSESSRVQTRSGTLSAAANSPNPRADPETVINNSTDNLNALENDHSPTASARERVESGSDKSNSSLNSQSLDTESTLSETESEHSDNSEDEQSEWTGMKLNGGKVILRKARLKLDNRSSGGAEGPFSNANAHSNSSGNSNPGLAATVKCGVCGAVRFYRFVKQARKFGIHSCESCRKFISKMIKRHACAKSTNNVPPVLQCHKGDGFCLVPAVVRSQQWNLMRCVYKARCPACWLKMCLKCYNIPPALRAGLNLLLPPLMRDPLVTSQPAPMSACQEDSEGQIQRLTGCSKLGWPAEDSLERSLFKSATSWNGLDMLGQKTSHQNTVPGALGKLEKFDYPISVSPSKKRRKDNRIKVRKKVKNPSLDPSATDQFSQSVRQRLELKGPRVKHVCRSASVALGQPIATFPSGEGREDSVETGKNIPRLQKEDEKMEETKKVEDLAKDKELLKAYQDESINTVNNNVQQASQKRGKLQIHQNISNINPPVIRSLSKPVVDTVHTLHTVSIDFWEQYDPAEVGAKGFALIGSEGFHIPATCYLCGSAGKDPLIHCQCCCEPYHAFCLEPSEWTACAQPNWCCPRCTICQTCRLRSGPKLSCIRCRQSFHHSCLSKSGVSSRLYSPDRPYICQSCIKCKSCGSEGVSVHVGNLPLCSMCFKLRQAGNYCPLCQRCYDENDFDTKMMECNECSYWVHARCEGLSDERYEILSYLPDSIQFNCRQCTPACDPKSIWRNAVEVELKAGFIGVIKSLSKNRKACAALKWSPRKECLCRPISSVRKLDFSDEKREICVINGKEIINRFEEYDDCNSERSTDADSNQSTSLKSDNSSKSDFEADDQPTDPPRRGLRRLRQKFHLKECSVRVRNCLPKEGQEITEAKELCIEQETPHGSTPEIKECLCLEQQIIARPSPTLMSVKRKVNGNEYGSLLQFHCDMEHVINRASNQDLIEAYHKTLREVFPWFDPKHSRITSSTGGLSTPTKESYFKDADNSMAKLDDSILETWKEEVLRAPKAIAAKSGNLYNNINFQDSRSCSLCKGLGDGQSTREGRLLYCGQNEWVHANCALWSNEVFEEIDGSLQNVHSAISRGRLIRCTECGKKGASVGCCSKNCNGTYHYPCARNTELAFNDDKTVFCTLHLSNCSDKTPQSEEGFDLKRPVYVELDRKKKKHAEPHKVKVMIGSLTIDCLGSIVPEFSDTIERIIPSDYKCSRLYWSTVNPLKIVRYYVRTFVQVYVPEAAVDMENNVTIDHSKELENEIEREKLDLLRLERLAVKQTLDTLIDSVCNKEADENLAEQNNTDLLPPELKDAIFEDLPHDLLDGISMQDIFPKMTYEDFLAMDLKTDSVFGTDLLKDEILPPEVDEIIKPAENKVSKMDPSMPELGTQNDFWLHLEAKSSVQDIVDDLFNSKNQKFGGRELKRSKSEVMSNNSVVVAGPRHHQRSCSLTWSYKLDGTYAPTMKRRKIPKNSNSTRSEAAVTVMESQNERTPILHELRIPESIMVTVGRASTPSIISESVRELKYCIEDSGVAGRRASPRDEGKEHKRLLWHARQHPRILQVDGSADIGSASECSSPEYTTEDRVPPLHSLDSIVRIPQVDGANDEAEAEIDKNFHKYASRFSKLRWNDSISRSEDIHGEKKEPNQSLHPDNRLSFKIPQLDGADDVSSDDECSSPLSQATDELGTGSIAKYLPIIDPVDQPVTCKRCRCTYRTQDSYNRHLATCDIMTTSDSDSETMDNKLASPDSRFSPSIGSSIGSPQFITMSPSEGHTLSSDYQDIQATSPVEASVPSPHPGIQIEPIAQAIMTPQIHTHATVETVHQTVLTSNDMIVQTQYTRTTTTLPNTTVLPQQQQQQQQQQESTVQITEITDPPSMSTDSNCSITQSAINLPLISPDSTTSSETIPSPQISPTFLSTGVQTSAHETAMNPSIHQAKISKPRSPRTPKPRAKGIKPNILRASNIPQSGHVRFQTIQNNTPIIQLQQAQRNSGPTVILQQVPQNNLMSAYVEALQQQSGQNLQYVATIGGQHETGFKPQFITANSLVPGAYIQASSDNLLTLQNGGISVLPSVQIAQPQPTVLGTIIQQQPGAIQCGVISSEQLVLSSAPALEMFTDSTGSMFVSSQPMYYGLETIVSNTVMSSSQFVAGAVPQVLASSYQTTTQVFQASKLMEPMVDVQSVSNVPNVPSVQTVQGVPGVPGSYVVVNQPAPNMAEPSHPQMNIPAPPEQAFNPSNCNPVSPAPCLQMTDPVRTIQATQIQPIVSSAVSQREIIAGCKQLRQQQPQQPPATIPRVAVRPSPVSHTTVQPMQPMQHLHQGPWRITEPLFAAEQPMSNSVRPYFDSKRVSENTSMIKSSISSKIPPLSSHCCTPQRNDNIIVNKSNQNDVNNVHNNYGNTMSNNTVSNCNINNISNSNSNNINSINTSNININPVNINVCIANKITMPVSNVPTSRPMNRVLPMQAITSKPEPVERVKKPNIVIEEPNKLTVQNSKHRDSGIIEPVRKPDAVVNDLNNGNMKLSNDRIDRVKENLKLELDKDKLQTKSLKIVFQKQLQDGSYKITQNMKTVSQNKRTPQITSVEVLSPRDAAKITSLQLSPLKSFALKTSKIENKAISFEDKMEPPKPRPPPIAVKKPRIISKIIKSPKNHPPKLAVKKSILNRPSMMYEIKSQDGFTHIASSMSEVWEKVFEAVQSARRAHNLPPLPHNPLTENLGLENNATVYLVEQLPGVNRCTKYKPKLHNLTPPKPGEIENDLLAECESGAARAESFKGRKVHDMFSWLASRHRQQPKMIAISENESRRAASTNLPMAMRFRILKQTTKESVGVYHSHIHGRGLFCLRDIEAGEMVIEYAGEVIRASLTDKREKYYDSKHIGCYMFKIDDHLVVDATMKGNAARFINHSCEPNCYSRVVDILGKKHILIFALRRIVQGEELTYDYKFPFEDIKIPCTCGSRRCRKYLN